MSRSRSNVLKMKCQLQSSTYCEGEINKNNCAYYKGKMCCQRCYNYSKWLDKCKRSNELHKERDNKRKSKKD